MKYGFPEKEFFDGVYFVPFWASLIRVIYLGKLHLERDTRLIRSRVFHGSRCWISMEVYSSFGALFNRSSLNAIETGGPKVTYEGTEYLLNMDINLGARFYLNDFTTWTLGLGVGGSFQQFSSTFAKVLNHQDYGFSGTANFHTSLGFLPSENWYFGIGYKLMRIRARFLHRPESAYFSTFWNLLVVMPLK